MNVSEQIINVLDNLCQKFGMAIDWTSANVMPYLTELCSRICKYEITTSIVWMIIGVIMLIGSIAYFRYSWKNSIDWDEYDITHQQVNGVMSIIALIVCGIIGVAVICTQTFEIIEVICIPELTIIEKINSLITSIPNS